MVCHTDEHIGSQGKCISVEKQVKRSQFWGCCFSISIAKQSSDGIGSNPLKQHCKVRCRYSCAIVVVHLLSSCHREGQSLVLVVPADVPLTISQWPTKLVGYLCWAGESLSYLLRCICKVPDLMQIDPKSPIRKQTKPDVVFLKQILWKVQLSQNCLWFSVKSSSVVFFLPFPVNALLAPKIES